MTTAFQTGPGFYAAETSKKCRSLVPGTMRVYCARMEAYDVPENDVDGLSTEFHLLFAKAEGNPEIARAILLLGKCIEKNSKRLEDIARE
ncbi:MAG: hypothetical protein IAE97_00305 [Chthoniobacterales bacterium]|nr:hypothetical protein [Chthoniobacterales bacterium]